MKKKLFFPVFGLFCMALGGFLLHSRIHPPSKDAFNWVAVGFPAFNAFILPLMFFGEKTWRWAYLINAITVLVGVVAMTYHSIHTWNQPLTILTVLQGSTLADSLILLARLPLAQQVMQIWQEQDNE